jgi:hypothetical protein
VDFRDWRGDSARRDRQPIDAWDDDPDQSSADPYGSDAEERPTRRRRAAHRRGQESAERYLPGWARDTGAHALPMPRRSVGRHHRDDTRDEPDESPAPRRRRSDRGEARWRSADATSSWQRVDDDPLPPSGAGGGRHADDGPGGLSGYDWRRAGTGRAGRRRAWEADDDADGSTAEVTEPVARWAVDPLNAPLAPTGVERWRLEQTDRLERIDLDPLLDPEPSVGWRRDRDTDTGLTSGRRRARGLDDDGDLTSGRRWARDADDDGGLTSGWLDAAADDDGLGLSSGRRARATGAGPATGRRRARRDGDLSSDDDLGSARVREPGSVPGLGTDSPLDRDDEPGGGAGPADELDRYRRRGAARRRRARELAAELDLGRHRDGRRRGFDPDDDEATQPVSGIGSVTDIGWRRDRSGYTPRRSRSRDRLDDDLPFRLDRSSGEDETVEVRRWRDTDSDDGLDSPSYGSVDPLLDDRWRRDRSERWASSSETDVTRNDRWGADPDQDNDLDDGRRKTGRDVRYRGDERWGASGRTDIIPITTDDGSNWWDAPSSTVPDGLRRPDDPFAETGGWDRLADTGEWTPPTSYGKSDPDDDEPSPFAAETFWAGTRLAGDDPRWMDTPVSAPRSPVVESASAARGGLSTALPDEEEEQAPVSRRRAESAPRRRSEPGSAPRRKPAEGRRARGSSGGRSAPPGRKRVTVPMPGPVRQRARKLEDDLLPPDRGGPLAAVLYTGAWYAVPVLVVFGWLLTISGDIPQGCVTDVSGGGCYSPRTRALASLLNGTPKFGLALVVSLVLALLLRRVLVTWRARSVGLAAAVLGGGLSTVVISALTDKPLG